MAESGADRTTDRPAPVALRPDADRGAVEEAKFAELRSLLVGPERREVVDLKAQLADRQARTLEVSGVLADAVAHSAKSPQLARALAPAIEQALSASAREDPRPLADALLPVLRRAIRKSMAQMLTPLITLGCAALLVGGVWMFQTFRAGQQWNDYLGRLSTEPGIVVIQSGRRDGKFFVRGLRDELASDPAVLLASSGLTADSVESRWEPYQALHPTFVTERARAVLQPPPGVTLAYRDGVLTATGTAPPTWISDSRRVAPALAGVRRFEYSGGSAAAAPPPAKPPVQAALPAVPAAAPPPPPPPQPQIAATTSKPLPRPGAASPELRLMEQIEVTTLVFSPTNRDLAPGQEAAVRRLASLFRELNEIVHARGTRARIDILGHTPDSSSVANTRLAKARADAALALFRTYKFDALILTSNTDASALSPPESSQTERGRRVSFRVQLLGQS